MKVITEIANTLDPNIQMTFDTPSQNRSGKLPCLDLQLWVTDEGIIMHEFYSKPVTTPYLILNRSAVSNGVKRATLFQEGIRRLRNCYLELEWDQKVKHLNRFSWQMLVSGYHYGMRLNIIKGVLNRYDQMLRDHQGGNKPFYRRRDQIASQKAAKPGRSPASYFLKGSTRQTMNLPPTPGGELVKMVRNQLGNFMGPDRGTTKYGERAGSKVTAGLSKDDPFPALGCDFNDSSFLVGAGCSKLSQTYEIKCNVCSPEDHEAARQQGGINRRPQPAEVRGGVRRCMYVGQTGTTLHRRQVSHKSDKDSALNKHTREAHRGDQRAPGYRMRAIKGSHTVLQRIVTEGVYIDHGEKLEPGTLMNSRGEAGRGKMVRYVPQTRRI